MNLVLFSVAGLVRLLVFFPEPIDVLFKKLSIEDFDGVDDMFSPE